MKHSTYIWPVRRRHQGAFSLIETVLALGIMGLAITALLGLLPHGIEMSRKAANVSAMSRILDTIQSRLASNSFATLSKLPVTVLHFDDQGIAVEDGATGVLATYVVRVRSPGGGSAVLPGSNKPETTLLRFMVDVAATGNPNFNFDTAAHNAYDTTPILIGPLVP